MTYNYENALQGTRQDALAAVAEIQKNMQRYGATGHADALKHQMQFGLSVLRNVCRAGNSAQAVHHDVYCDILVRVLEPHIQPKVNADLWARIVEYVRYLHYLMINGKHHAEAEQIFNFLSRRKHLLQSAADYKFVLSTYCQHLLLQRSRQQSAEAATQTLNALKAINALFDEMLQQNKTQHFQYPELLSDFLNGFMPKRTAAVFSFVTSINDIGKTFQNFFDLLSALKWSAVSAEVINQQAQLHVEALYAFLQFDVQDKLQHKLCLQHVRTCRDLNLWQQNKSLANMFVLLYYYIKFVYTCAALHNFSSVYAELCGRFVSFFEKSGEILLQNKWFLDMLILLKTVFLQMQQYPNTPTNFDSFWQQMNTVEGYTAHLKLILACIKLAPAITDTKLISWTCCTSTRKHIIIALSISALSAYSTYQLHVKLQQENHQDLQNNLIAIVRHVLRVMDTLSCINNTSNELKIFFARLVQLTQDVSTAAQAYFCATTLANELIKLRQKLQSSDWTLLMRRIAKTAVKSNNAQLTGELMSCYIVTLLQERAEPNYNILRNQIGVFYTTPLCDQQLHEKCLLQWHDETKHKLRTALQPQEKRLLLWLETQLISIYEPSNVTLQMSLVHYAQSPQDYMFVVRACKLHNEAALQQVQKIYNNLKAKSAAQMQRLDYLVLAQSNCTLLLSETHLENRQIFSVDSNECKEDSLVQLMQRKEISVINISNELRLINLAVDAIQAYEYFYEQADAENLSSDEVFIDWELIMNDLRNIALYLQFSGYTDHATRAWLLYYGIASTLQDTYSQFCGLAYFCENAEYFEHNMQKLDLQVEVQRQLQPLADAMQILPTLLRRHQNAVLLSCCQLAYYYARAGNFAYAEILMAMVLQKHAQLPERTGKYDIVLGTLETVRFRIMWKHMTNASLNSACNLKLAQDCLLSEIEMTMDRFREFAYISSGDALAYLILLFNLTLQVTECTVNRLCDNLAHIFYPNALKAALQTGSALRVTQILTAWMWTNLQAEHVKKAQIKLQLIECILGINSCTEIKAAVKKAEAQRVSSCALENASSIDMLSDMMLYLNMGVEAQRRVEAQQMDFLSPLKSEVTELHENIPNWDLKRFFKWNGINNMENAEIFRWSYFSVGCLNARLCYLIGDHAQLIEFYDSAEKWLHNQKNKFLLTAFQNIELLSIQHYANYLHASKKFEMAQRCVERGLVRCKQVERNVDVCYNINFMLQLDNIKQAQKIKRPAKVGRALTFNSSPNKTKDCDANLTSSMHKTNTQTPFTIYSGEESSTTKSIARKTTKKSVKPKSNTKRVLNRQLTPTLSSSASESCINTPSSASSLDEPTVDLNTCQIIDLQTSSEFEDTSTITQTVKTTISKPRKPKENVETKISSLKESNAMVLINAENDARKLKKPNQTKRTTDKNLQPEQQDQPSTLILTRQRQRLPATPKVATPKTRRRPRKSNNLINDENEEPVLKELPKRSALTRRRQNT